MPTVLERLAEVVSAVKPGDLPDEVVHEARRRLLDGLANMLGGSGAPTVRSVYAAVGSSSGAATLAGDQRRATAADAALANCTALRYLDYMDGHPGPYPCHPSLVIPPALAVAEARHRSGADLARAIVLGYEVDIRLQIASGDPDITAHGWSGSSNLGMAVPAALSGLLDLDSEQLAHALAISTVHSPTLDASGRGQMAPSKSCVDGMVAQSAVTATLLAEAGMRGKLSAYEGDDGFLAGVARTYDEDVLLAPVERFRVLDAYTKQYNAVKCAQSAAGSALRLRPRIGGPEEIEAITLSLAERDWRNQSGDVEARRRPGNRDTANHSVLYCLAAALVDGRLQADQFGPDRLADPRILAVVDRTRIAPEPELSAYWPGANPARVHIRLRSGQELEDTTIYFPGHPRNPVSDADLEDKFRSLAEPVLGASGATAVVEAVRSLDRLPDVRGLVGLLTHTLEGRS
ncbi:MAG TPA: MmgE/PrpD family protein [Mycobacteriales bacterium]|nr:MmgE/PrpD family protein [Mycobacteriales bacterium]